MRRIEIEWVQPGITVTAELTEQNPRLADLLWSKFLPYNSLQNHALVSGNHLYHLVPHPELIYTEADYREDRTQSPDGTVFLSQLQHLAVKYGPLSEYLLAAPVGRVFDAHLDLLRQVGQACWEATWSNKQPIEVRVRREGDSAVKHALPRQTVVNIVDVQKVIDEIHDETQLVWVDPPPEIINMHRGQIDSRAGSRDQYFSTLVFLNGETRPLGYCALNGLIKVCQTSDASLDMLKKLVPTFIKVPAEFLGYTGLATLWRFTQQVLDVLPQVETKEQYFVLINSLALYANVLNTWNLHYFPWDHGEQYSYSKKR